MTKPGAERRVADQFTNLLHRETYLPVIELPVRRGRRALALQPLFPRYLFVRLDLAADWRTVTFTRGVVKILGGWSDPKPVPEEMVTAIRGREREQDRVIQYYNFRPEERVVVTHGPLKDMMGIFQRHVDGRGRVRVLLSSLGYQAAAELDASCLDRI
jgi:transcription antitermination factor NusG